MPIAQSATRIHSFLKEKEVFLYIYYLSIAASLIGFLYSRALLSIGQISLVIIWFLEGDLSSKIARFRRNKMARLFAGLYIMHVLFLINSSDFVYAAEDLRIKLPLLLFPVVLSTIDLLNAEKLKYTFYLFIAVIFSSTAVIGINYALNKDQFQDIREASFLISHIRLALMICLSIAALIYYSSKEKSTPRLLLLGLSVYFVIYMVYFVYLTGIAVLAVLSLFMLLYYIRRSSIRNRVRRGVLLILIILFSAVSTFIFVVAKDYFEANNEKVVEDLELTVNGNHYTQWHKMDGYGLRENGNLVYQNLCFDEIEREWNRRSDLNIKYINGEYKETEDVLLRFLASKGLPKDSMAVASLSDVEIREIERGCTNTNYVGRSKLYKRIYNMLWQYDIYFAGGDINGHSLGIRMEFWKTGWNVFKRHWLFGTGTGDIENAFQEQYVIDQSRLSQEWRFRSHNQLISMAATFGIAGLIYFLVVIILPIIKKRDNFLYLTFSLIFIVSIFTEDTLETQIGVTFYAMFNSLLFFQGKDKN